MSRRAGKFPITVSIERAKLDALLAVGQNPEAPLREAGMEIALRAREQVVANVRSVLGTRKGRLSAAWGKARMTVKAKGSYCGVRVSVSKRAAPHYRIQHTGGEVIGGRTTQWLRIPLTDEGHDAGRRILPDTFVVKSKAGNLVVVRRREGGGLEPIFALKKRMKVPASRYLDLPRADVRREAPAIFKSRIVYALKNAGAGSAAHGEVASGR